MSSEQPFRLGDDQPGVVFHRVLTPDYPLFREPQYVLSLSTKIVELARGGRSRHHPRALRHPARRGRLPRAAGPRRHRAGRGAEARHHAARHGHHAGRQRPVVFARRSGSASTSRTASPPCPRASRPTPTAAAGPQGHPRHPELPRLLAPPPRGRAACCASGWRRTGSRRRHPRVELPAGQADRRGRRGLRPHPRAPLHGSCWSATVRSCRTASRSPATSASRTT